MKVLMVQQFGGVRVAMSSSRLKIGISKDVILTRGGRESSFPGGKLHHGLLQLWCPAGTREGPVASLSKSGKEVRAVREQFEG